MKKLLLTIVFACGLFGAVYAANEPAQPADNNKLKELEEQEKKLALEMYKLRIEIIKKDPALLRLHKQIIALHKELSLKVDNKKEMRLLLNSYNEITRQIEDNKAAAAKPAAAAKQ
jgi:hypothetical protein